MDNQARPSLFVSARSAHRRIGWRRGARWALVGLVVLLILSVLTAAGLFFYADRRIDRQEFAGLGDDEAAGLSPEDLQPVEGVLDILVVGTDSRAGLTEQQLQELGTEVVAGPDRADTIMLVHVSPARPDAIVVSFPRDLKVQIPGEGTQKINAALAFGGPELLIETVERFTRVPIDHYVEVDLAGFLQLVEVIGGVEVCLEEPLVDPDAGADLPAGRQVLTGKDAAGYVRARKSDPRGDLGRIERQQDFIRQAMRKVLSPATLANPVRVKQLIDRGAAAVTADAGFSTTDMFRLAWSMKSLDPDTVTMMTVPSDAGPSFVEARPEEAEALFQAIRADEELPDGELPVDAPPAVDPADVELTVLNAAGAQGLAGRAADYLTERGFVVVDTGNAESFDLARTEVRHGPDDAAGAAAVAAYFPNAEVVEQAEDGVAVAVGVDWAEDPVEVTSPDATPPVSAATPTPTRTSTPAGSGRCAT